MSDGEQPYTARPSACRNPGERIPAWQCACPNLPPRQQHREPWECVTREKIAAWRAAHPASGILNDITVRCLVWLAREFGR